MKNVLALVRNGSSRITTHQAVCRLVAKLERKRQVGVDLRKIGFWARGVLEKQLQVW